MTATPLAPAGRRRLAVRPAPEPPRGDAGSGRRLLVRYLWTGLLTVVLVGVVAGYAGRSVATDNAIDEATRATQFAATTVVEPLLDDAVLAGDPEALAALDAAVREHVLRGSLIRVKMWDAAGRIVYSDEPRLVGRTFPVRIEELGALRTGEVRAHVTDLAEPENLYEAPAVQLLEVYQPMRTPTGAPVMFEAYHRYDGVSADGRREWMRFAPFSLGALVLLQLLQIPIVLALARRLRRSQDQREQLHARSVEATDAERRRIAADLHDGVVQDLAGVAFSLGAAARVVSAQGGDAALFADPADRVRQAVRSLRSLLVEIYPPNLYEEGLEAALSDLLARLAPRGIRTSLVVEGDVRGLGVGETELLYRVAQEGVRNVVAHAAATAVEIVVRRGPSRTVLTVADDGRGVDQLAPRPGHFGLRALADLAAQVGGELLLDTAPHLGTTLRVEVPER